MDYGHIFSCIFYKFSTSVLNCCVKFNTANSGKIHSKVSVTVVKILWLLGKKNKDSGSGEKNAGLNINGMAAGEKNKKSRFRGKNKKGERKTEENYIKTGKKGLKNASFWFCTKKKKISE